MSVSQSEDGTCSEDTQVFVYRVISKDAAVFGKFLHQAVGFVCKHVAHQSAKTVHHHFFFFFLLRMEKKSFLALMNFKENRK